MPASRRARLIQAGLKEDVTEIIISDPSVAIYFDEVTTGKDAPYMTLAANYLVADIFGLLKKETRDIAPENFPPAASFKVLLDMIQAGELSSRGAKDLLPLMLAEPTITVVVT
jgi:Asp-tRNA(Asn)/Glu-tRNA(Gln) amidotransferase B subunit